jgi:hypothetical protein
LPGCCARAASGHAAAPPRNVMNVRRFMSDMGFPAPWVATSIRHRPSRHEVTISHPPGVNFSAQCRARLPGNAAPAPQALRLQKRFSARFLEQGRKLILRVQKSPLGGGSSHPSALPRVLFAYAPAATLACSASSRAGYVGD